MALTLDGRAILTGAAIALAVAVPAQLISQAIDSGGGEGEHAGLFAVAFLVALGAFLAGGYVAASRRLDAPLAHGAVAALAAFAIAQGIGIIRRGVAGEDITWLSIPFNALLAASFGMIGGLLANRRAS